MKKPNTDAIRFAGDDLLSVTIDDSDACQQLAAHLRVNGEWIEAVAGISSCVVQFDNTRLDAADARRRLEQAIESAPETAAGDPGEIELPVCYGGEFGPDLSTVCEALGVDPERFIGLHTGGEHRVELIGFTPGFAYVGGFDTAAEVSRLAEPRLRVEAGSIGIAGGRSGVYALAGPGGWPLVGRTPVKLFDPQAEDPFRLRHGLRVRFRAIERQEYDEMSNA